MKLLNQSECVNLLDKANATRPFIPELMICTRDAGNTHRGPCYVGYQQTQGNFRENKIIESRLD